jgi:hypothetical protein
MKIGKFILNAVRYVAPSGATFETNFDTVLSPRFVNTHPASEAEAVAAVKADAEAYLDADWSGAHPAIRARIATVKAQGFEVKVALTSSGWVGWAHSRVKTENISLADMRERNAHFEEARMRP